MVGVLAAGYGTTNETLINAVHTLATRPEEMHKLQEEIDSIIASNVIKKLCDPCMLFLLFNKF